MDRRGKNSSNFRQLNIKVLWMYVAKHLDNSLLPFANKQTLAMGTAIETNEILLSSFCLKPQ